MEPRWNRVVRVEPACSAISCYLAFLDSSAARATVTEIAPSTPACPAASFAASRPASVLPVSNCPSAKRAAESAHAPAQYRSCSLQNSKCRASAPSAAPASIFSIKLTRNPSACCTLYSDQKESGGRLARGSAKYSSMRPSACLLSPASWHFRQCSSSSRNVWNSVMLMPNAPGERPSPSSVTTRTRRSRTIARPKAEERGDGSPPPNGWAYCRSRPYFGCRF